MKKSGARRHRVDAEALLRSGACSLQDALCIYLQRGEPVPAWIAQQFLDLVLAYEFHQVKDFAKAIGLTRVDLKAFARRERQDEAYATVRQISEEQGLPITNPDSCAQTAFHAAAEVLGVSVATVYARYTGRR